MARRPVVLLLVLLLTLVPLPIASAVAADAIGVQGPDGDGAFRLLFDLHAASAVNVTLRLDVARTDADGSRAGSRELGTMALATGTTRINTSFLPTEGPGSYAVALVVQGERRASLSFDVDDASSTRTISYEVPDEPTYLDLTSDDVNANGKVKAPGDALVTRATLSDRNGVGDIESLRWRVERDGIGIEEGALLPGAPADATSASLEHRYARSPLEAGNYVWTLRAMKGAAVVANATRTFTIRDVAPSFVSGALANVTPDAETRQDAILVLADKNGAPGALELRVYRGSARAESAGLAATLGAPSRLADADGAARHAFPLGLTVPARAAPGAYRVSIYSNATLVASLPFAVEPVPALVSVEAAGEGALLRLRVHATGAGLVTATLTDGAGWTTSATAPLAEGRATLALDAPRRGTTLVWNATLRAREGGAALDARNGTWSAPLDGPELRLAPLHARGRLPATWRVETPGGIADANASFTFARWDGAPEPGIVARLDGTTLRVEGPNALAAGLYRGTMRLAWPDGRASETTWTFEAGAFAQISLGEPVVEGRSAAVRVTNTGTLPIHRLLVEVEPRANVTLVEGNATLAPRLTDGRAAFTLRLDPGEEAQLRIDLPDGPRRSGRHAMALRVLARVEP